MEKIIYEKFILNPWNMISVNNDLYIETVKSRKRNKQLYFKNPNSFDIEVTNYTNNDEKTGISYLWVYAISGSVLYYGRTLEDFAKFLDLYCDMLESHVDAKQVIYVHNLSYEFQFLRKIIEWEEVFLIDARKPLLARYRNMEFRCSYILTNMSLANFLKNQGCALSKLSYDYTKKRYPWTDLSPQEILYCATDTAGLYEGIQNLLKNDKKNISAIPLTSTGYVRQDIKKSQTKTIRNKIKRLSHINADLYQALKKSFVGGNTHANRMHANKIIENVNCYDITSSYPYCQMCCEYPIEPFREKTQGLNNLKLDPKFAYLLLCEISNIYLTDYFDGMPNISLSKCLVKENVETDNGRILSADKILIWLTDIEYSITRNHYTFEVEFKKCYYSRYGLLPDCIKGTIYTYFENKCTLKEKDPYLYMKSKNKLNSIYGMSAFDIGKQRYLYQNGEYEKDNRSIEEILSEMFENTTPAEPYSWGVWTTARARQNLDEVVRLAGDRFIYCDTDSVYVIGELDLEEINERIREKSKPYSVDHKENSYYLGVWKHDKHCSRFITLGAKKYCYEDTNGVHTVTAGVSKKAGVEKIEEYKEGYVFKNATNNAWYIDEEQTLHIDGHTITIPTSIYIEPSDYTLGMTEIYRALLIAHGLAGLNPFRE